MGQFVELTDQLFAKTQGLTDALTCNVNVVLLDFVTYPSATEMLRHFQSCANPGKRIEHEIALVGIELNKAIRNLLGKRAGMIILAGRHRGDVPDVVGDLAGKD